MKQLALIHVLASVLLGYALAVNDCDRCVCCKNGKARCQYYDNTSKYCLDGCINGYFGSRCTSACQSQCLTCSKLDICNSCKDGYYSDVNTDCRLKCRTSCKSCTNHDNCTECKDGYYGTGADVCGNTCQDTCKSCTSYDNCNECADGKFNGNFKNCSESCIKDCISCTSVDNCTACDIGKYGNSCQNVCGLGCENRVCDINTGDCTCLSNFHGGRCDQCSPNYYGTFCNLSCSVGCLNTSCAIDGNCDCKTGFNGSKCDQCLNGNYGLDCNTPCPQNCTDGICLRGGSCLSCVDGFYGAFCNISCPDDCALNFCTRDGNCSDCKSGFSGIKCDECAEGRYGDSCDLTCPTGCTGNICSRTGECTGGCKIHFNGPNCESCVSGMYGDNCNISCIKNCKLCTSESNCSTCYEGYWGKTCEPCPENCLNHTCIWKTGYCLNGCDRMNYGKQCEKKCSINCRTGKTERSCNEKTGHCILGCVNGFYGDFCDQRCNTNCMNATCNRDAGQCLHGCLTGYTGIRCAQALTQTTDNTGIVIGAAAGGSLFLIITILVFIGVVILKKRRKRMKSETNDLSASNGNTVNTAVKYSDLTLGPSVDQDNAEPVYAVPNKKKKQAKEVNASDRKPSRTVSNPSSNESQDGGDNGGDSDDNEGTKENDRKSPTSVPPRPHYVNTTITGSVPVTPTTKKHLGSPNDSAVEIEEDLNSEELTGDIKTEVKPEGSEVADTYYNVTAVNRMKVTLEQLPCFVSKKTDEDFVEEFQQLPTGLIKPFLDSQRRENISKNRYKGIYPYDKTRIVLKEMDSDYINASYIDGYNKRNAYIASIGPTNKYMGDMSAFWIMVWQKKVGKIVMLTKLFEGGEPKCDQYWPEKDFTLLYADIQITCRSEDTYADYTVRTFTIQKESEKRNIVQVHFTAWPDKGTPDDVTSLIEFRQKVNKTKTDLKGPVIVHCSAGIGRTGTYIALDSLTAEGEAEGKVDIYGCVRNMREQRVNMVQTVEQYKFLHDAIVHILTFDCKPVEASKFCEYMKTNTNEHIGKKFKTLQDASEQRANEEIEAVKRNQAMKSKNRVDADIPGDHYRPKLYLDRTLGSPDYINAVYVDSHQIKNRYLVAQTPLPNTVVDLLTLIVQEKVSCIINMDADSETANEKTTESYFPKANQTLNEGSFTVKSEGGKVTERYQLRTLNISYKGHSGKDEVSLPYMHFTRWCESTDVPEDPTEFVQYVRDVELNSGRNKGPILVHCLDGARKSGLFCVVSILLEKAQIDHEVSVLNTVRHIKYRRSTAIPNKEQYIFCHQCLESFLRSPGT